MKKISREGKREIEYADLGIVGGVTDAAALRENLSEYQAYIY
jgi:hypothetical protein